MRRFGIPPFVVLLFLTGVIGAQAPAPAKPVPVIFETELGRITMEVDIVIPVEGSKASMDSYEMVGRVCLGRDKCNNDQACSELPKDAMPLSEDKRWVE